MSMLLRIIIAFVITIIYFVANWTMLTVAGALSMTGVFIFGPVSLVVGFAAAVVVFVLLLLAYVLLMRRLFLHKKHHGTETRTDL